LLLERNPQSRLAIWGLAYKENTHSVKNSPSLAAIAQIPDAYLRVHDPVVSASQVDHRHIEACAEPLDALRGSEALLILTPWPQYRQITPENIAASLKGRIVIDPYKVLDPEQAHSAGLSYYTLGQRGPRSDRSDRQVSTVQAT
jgi:UDPglucose 6-dehydrogenase